MNIKGYVSWADLPPEPETGDYFEEELFFRQRATGKNVEES
jgi:hypothetical protein